MNYRVKLIGDLDIAIRIKEYLKSDEWPRELPWGHRGTVRRRS